MKCVQAIKQGRRKATAQVAPTARSPRPVIEKLVVEALLDQLLQPERVTSIPLDSNLSPLDS
jgi:hypothetical protein